MLGNRILMNIVISGEGGGVHDPRGCSEYSEYHGDPAEGQGHVHAEGTGAGEAQEG